MQGLGTQLRHLLELLDGGVDEIYQRDGLDYRPRYTPVMRALEDVDHLTIKAIAKAAGISHSAASQTVSKMIKVDLVEHASSQDGRERLIQLTSKARRMLPQLHARWLATQYAADELDAELAQPLSQIAAEAIRALQGRPFVDRIAEKELIALETQV